MFLLRSQTELVRAFRPRDQRTLELPPGLRFPLVVHDYLSWVEPTGARVFVAFLDPDSRRPVGIAFRRDVSGGCAQMCDWCHSSGSAEEIGLLTATKSSKRRLGVILCRDLRCKQRLEQAADLSGTSPREPIKRMLGRMVRFAREGLGIEPGALVPEPPEATEAP